MWSNMWSNYGQTFGVPAGFHRLGFGRIISTLAVPSIPKTFPLSLTFFGQTIGQTSCHLLAIVPAGFRRLGFGRIISTLAVPFIHGSFSYPTAPTILPDPFFR
jgi:hypothetical protein